MSEKFVGYGWGKCNRCNKPAVVNMRGKCATCHAAAQQASEPNQSK